MTSADVKKALAAHLLWKGGMKAIAHEHSTGLSQCDVFAMNKDFRSFEYEIKVSASDLRGELAIIKAVLSGVDPRLGRKGVSWSKSEKHRRYLNRNQTWMEASSYQPFVPNYFYFVVPDELVSEAVAGCQGTPYGVMRGGDTYLHNNSPFQVHKRAFRMHEETMTIKQVTDLCRRLCWVAYYAEIDPLHRTIK
jgi:hypothetical protein